MAQRQAFQAHQQPDHAWVLFQPRFFEEVSDANGIGDCLGERAEAALPDLHLHVRVSLQVAEPVCLAPRAEPTVYAPPISSYCKGVVRGCPLLRPVVVSSSTMRVGPMPFW